MTRVALDAMGGDRGLPVNVDGALAARREWGHEVVLVGDRPLLEAALEKRGAKGALPIEHAGSVVGMHEKPAEACRGKKDSSIMLCAKLVADGRAEAFVSAGHSGAAMAAALWHLKRLPGVSRPAIATVLPTLRGSSVVLDMGANVDCKPRHLLQFAVMGAEYARVALGVDRPRVALLTIGEEEGKGNELTLEAHRLLKTAGLHYVGHAEGRDIPRGTADVYVCDGFVGNVILKFGEGLAAALFTLIKDEIRKRPLAMVGALLSKGAFRAVKKKTDPSEYGGAPLLGVGGVAVIAHGGSDAKAIKNAVNVAARSAQAGVNDRISDHLRRLADHAQPVEA